MGTGWHSAHSYIISSFGSDEELVEVAEQIIYEGSKLDTSDSLYIVSVNLLVFMVEPDLRCPRLQLTSLGQRTNRSSLPEVANAS